MSRGSATRRRKTPSALRGVIARNVKLRGKQLYPLADNLPKKIREESGTGDSDRLTLSHVKRIMAAQTSASLEQLEGLARALDLSAYQLLIPDLDATNPQVAKGATADEQALYRRIAREEAVKALQESQPAPTYSKIKTK